MRFIKFNTFLILGWVLTATTNGFAVEKFTSDSCLESSFNATISHNGEFWGLVKKDLVLEKKECQVIVKNQALFDTTWTIDVCREPIHMKVLLRGNLNVVKREGSCLSSAQSDYCDYWFKLRSSLEDLGLIFAQGERESLDSDHGKAYCLYLLLNKHLGDGVLFSKYEKNVDIYDQELFESSSVGKAAQSDETISGEKISGEKVKHARPTGRF